MLVGDDLQQIGGVFDIVFGALAGQRVQRSTKPIFASVPNWTIGGNSDGSSKAPAAIASPSGASNVSGVPQSPQNPRSTKLEDRNFFRVPRVHSNSASRTETSGA